MKKILILLLIITFNTNAELTGNIKVEYIKSAYESCYKSQKSMEDNKKISDTILKKYCKCSSEYSSKNITNKQLTDVETGKREMSILTNLALLTSQYCKVHLQDY